MILDTPLGKFRWIENWITIPDSPLGKINGRTHGIVVLKSGEIVIFHQANPAVLFYSPEGDLLRSWGDYPGAHGLTLVEENGVEHLWLTDQDSKQVVKTSLEGEVLMSLTQPPHDAYLTDSFVPTWVAVAEERFGGNGDIWLADGYGAQLVHRFDQSGRYLATLDGTEGGGRFKIPHGLAFDTRRSDPEFYIADRTNRRIQVYAMDGTYRRTFGDDFLKSPDVSVRWGSQNVIVPEIGAGITILDQNDRPIASIGFNAEVRAKEGWPNHREWITEGKFNSPHSAVADAFGNLYVVEWIIGGRVIKLESCSENSSIR